MQEKLGVVSLFKDIPGPFELLHKNFPKTSCVPRTVQGVPVGSYSMGRKGGESGQLGKRRPLFPIRDTVPVLQEHNLDKVITSLLKHEGGFSL